MRKPLLSLVVVALPASGRNGGATLGSDVRAFLERPDQPERPRD